MKTREERERFLTVDLRERGGQASWDWPADARFAAFIEDREAAEIFKMACDSHAPLFHKMRAVKTVDRVRKLRLRTLARMVKGGSATAHWIGTGAGGATELGINRTRAYFIAEHLK